MVDKARTIAHSTGIEITDAAVYIITNAIRVFVLRAGPAAIAHHIGHIAFAIAIACRDVSTAAIIDSPGAVAHSASIIAAYARIDIVAGAVAVLVCRASAATFSQNIQCGATAIFIGGIFIVIAGILVGTTRDFCIVAHIVSINVCSTIAVAYA